MKIYGYTGFGKTKRFDLGYEDMLSIAIGARKSSIGRIKTDRDYKSSLRNSDQKRYLRRYYKKAVRHISKLETYNNY